MKRIFYIIAFLAIISGCKKSEMLTMKQGEEFVNFVKGQHYPQLTGLVDSIYCSTLLAPQSGGERVSMKIKLPVVMSGEISSTEREFKVSVDDSECKDLINGTHYSLAAKNSIKAGKNRDTVEVTLNVKKIESDAIKNGRLYLKIEANENFTSPMYRYSYVVINVYGGVFNATIAPDFWAVNGMTEYAGSYTSGKAKAFVDMHNITEIGWVAPNKAVLYDMARQTYLYLQNNMVYEENGTTRVLFNGTVKF